MRNIGRMSLLLIFPFLYGCAQMRASQGWSLLDKGRVDEAIEAFELSRQKQELPGYFLGMYYSYIEKKDMSKAEEYLILGIKRYPDDFHLNFAMGYLLKVKGDNQQAIEYFEKCKRLKPNSSTSDSVDKAIAEAEGLIYLNKN